MIRFGPWSTLLAIGVAFGLAVALLLACTRTNTVANRLLAALLLVFVLKLMPYVLGFAGYYDAYPWLSFAPFDLGLSIGPLLYLHVRRLTASRLPPGWKWHLLPGALQLAYYATLFVQPLATKNRWNAAVHARWIDPLEALLELLSFAIYLWLTLRTYRAYQRWLDAHLSNREEFRIVWLRNVLLAFLLVWPVWAVYEALSYSIDFNYFQRFPLYVFLTLLVFYLGLEGWRHATTVYPLAGTPLPSIPESAPRAEPAGRDWEAQGRQWLSRTEQAGWWRDPDLSLERLARHLGTNTAYLSRALNEGLGLSFHALINQLRVDEVCRRLASDEVDDDLLAIAFAAGFNSKTSFNRTFKAQTGKTPTQFRESAVRTRTES
ncbi:helix-turn-helix domain-containing protein [Rhodanobacter sp. AS-Z3]|uniref:helix-turn-helix domain-containing protein n=1 Tax=Rhodanobacter sp. AS-Z3 TaxID=3031330 RepID=UPI00247AF518|nr:helix-turn-helix domain-containing protein [Rhodanobacter sp. AS-Z3]WEN14882.1 helix-turn-helix domain-containing protein [Rhodanobacter sp. AS-Z3]